MSQRNIFLGGCLVLGGLMLLGVVVGAAFFFHVVQDPKGVGVALESPQSVARDEVFELKVKVTNERTKKALKLSTIDVANEFLDGFVIVDIDPPAISSSHLPADNSRSFECERKLASGESAVFVFTLRAVKPGIWRGDVDVCEGMQFITAMAQVEVK